MKPIVSFIVGVVVLSGAVLLAGCSGSQGGSAAATTVAPPKPMSPKEQAMAKNRFLREEQEADKRP
jgi:hypothetical protein